MKKTLIALLLVGSSSGLFAQNTQNTTNTTNTNTSTNNSTTTDKNPAPSPTISDPATNTDVRTNANPNTDVNANTNVNTDATANPNSSINSSAKMSTNTDNNNMNNSSNVSATSSISSGTYNAYGTVAADVPATVRYSFQKEHPNVNGAQWYQTPNGQLRVMYKDANNQDVDVYYYGTSAQSYMISLPIRQSLTSDDIVTKAKTMFGLGIYDINRVKAANMEDVYHVRLLDNGQVRSVWISEQGTEVAAADVFRTAEVAENDIINEVNTTAPSTDANSTNNSSNNTINNTNTNNSSPAMNENSTSADANKINSSGNSENTNNPSDNKTTTPSTTPVETK